MHSPALEPVELYVVELRLKGYGRGVIAKCLDMRYPRPGGWRDRDVKLVIEVLTLRFAAAQS